ncbi:MAG: type I restriction endonuclease subunit R [Sphingomonadales bacterium]|nr:type I restriction endonuclease subunit R [Sphingomonadales bacterium]
MSLHKEISFEDEICADLSAAGLYEDGSATRYDRALALFPEDVQAWLESSQPQVWEALTKAHGPAAPEVLSDRLRKSISDRGTLDVLRFGVELIGVKGLVSLAQFAPASGLNPDIVARYNANRLRVVRQLRYSKSNENCIDLGLFLNGIPVATAELKTNFTQTIGDAIDQDKFDRNPRGEPLLAFATGALVHFAVSNRDVMMATKLEGGATRFLPFNRGGNGGAGNPPDGSGHPTGYLWQEVWQRDSWLEVIGRYMIAQRDKKKQISGIIFPRYHQLDATRKLRAQVKAEGAGGRFLIQHSAGSGKTNSIAWSAHFLADLHDAADQKIFSSVIVVSDRNVIDAQLQEALFEFERTKGVVATVTNETGSKSSALTDALDAGKKIIVCTMQTFPFALEAVRERSATQGKRFAVIADEAHSSQAGETAAKLKAVLSPEELADIGDGGEVSSEDILAAQMAARATDDGVTYVAFTATPKTKTIELFGRRPNPDLPAGPTNLPAPFHVYSMRQAIEEGFILDVLKNYTPYRLAFKLANGGEEWDEQEVEKSAAMKGIMRWVRLHPYNIAQKVQIVVEHFLENVAPLLNGKAKAMVVLGSRLEAVRWQVAIDKYIKSQGYKIGTLVAFSGEVNDPEVDGGPLAENSAKLNPGLKGRDIRDAFAEEEFKILLVANKFQTGFDQPLLCGMYIDRRLAGIQAVQTLSRLNRSHPGKDTTYVLDFVNSSEEVLQAFRQYFETAEIEATTDPNLIFDLRAKLDASGHYDDYEVERLVKAELDPTATQGQLIAALEPVAQRLLYQFKQAQDRFKAAQANKDKTATDDARDEMNALLLFKGDMGTFVRIYTFLSQIFDYGSTDIEKRFLFYKRLIPLLQFGREREGVDLSSVKLTHHNLKDEGKRNLSISGDKVPLPPITGAGSGSVQDKQKALLAEIIAKVNDLFEGELTDDDQLIYVNNVIKGKLLESESLRVQAQNNTKAQFAASPTLATEILNAVMDALNAHETMSSQALNNEKVRDGLKEILLGPGQLYEALRSGATTS